jgi:hypothetical protein
MIMIPVHVNLKASGLRFTVLFFFRISSILGNGLEPWGWDYDYEQ